MKQSQCCGLAGHLFLNTKRAKGTRCRLSRSADYKSGDAICRYKRLCSKSSFGAESHDANRCFCAQPQINRSYAVALSRPSASEPERERPAKTAGRSRSGSLVNGQLRNSYMLQLLANWYYSRYAPNICRCCGSNFVIPMKSPVFLLGLALLTAPSCAQNAALGNGKVTVTVQPGARQTFAGLGVSEGNWGLDYQKLSVGERGQIAKMLFGDLKLTSLRLWINLNEYAPDEKTRTTAEFRARYIASGFARRRPQKRRRGIVARAR